MSKVTTPVHVAISPHSTDQSGTRFSAHAAFWSILVTCLLAGDLAWSQRGRGQFRNSVGGVEISTDGVLAQANEADVKLARDVARKEHLPLSTELTKSVETRKVSLRAIEEAIHKSNAVDAERLPEEIRYLAGIQRIQFIFVYPDENDIVLAGPGEGWKVDDNANVVGSTTERPVVRLEDLVVALRTVEQARRGGISVSIDPTAEGRRNFEQYISMQRTFSPSVLDGIEKAMGDQQITLTGVPDTTRFARMLVVADYKMKCIGMGLERAPIAGLPSFIDMLKSSGAKLDNMMPRWWMATSYQPIGKSENGLAWEIRGKGVKVMTEDEFIDDGTVKGSGKANPIAQKWSDLMTDKYDELSTEEAAFGDLRNIMDLCVVAALIEKERLLEKARCEIPTLLKSEGQFGLEFWPAPKKVATQCSALRRGREWIITASGGVAINSWEAADRTEISPTLNNTRAKARPTQIGLWWN